MAIYVIRKLLYGLLVLLGVVLLVFTLFSFVPDPARELAGQNESEEVIQSIRKKYRLDLSYGQRLRYFMNDLSPVAIHDISSDGTSYLDESQGRWAVMDLSEKQLLMKKPYLGRSFLSNKNVSTILSEALPGTVVLAITAIVFAMFFGILFGIMAAIKHHSVWDHLAIVVTSIGMSGPSFFMAILIAWIGGVLLYDSVPLPIWPIVGVGIGYLLSRWKWESKRWFVYSLGGGVLIWFVLVIFFGGAGAFIHLPGTGLSTTGSLYEIDVWEGKELAIRNLILPALTLGIRPLSVITQLTRSSLLEVMGENYIRTARAKGLRPRQVIVKHALRNALNPVITAASGWFASMLAGAVFVEFVFGWKGIGFEIFQALEKNDLPVVMGGVLFIASIFVVINLLVDILYGWLDPRARLT